MSLILCVETATETCSIALSEDGICLKEHTLDEHMRHSSALTPMIKELFSDTALSMADLDAVCVSDGPGSYTGLRVGVTTAKAICYAHNIPLIAISSLKSIAHGVCKEISVDYTGLIIPTIDARRMEVYLAIYDEGLNPVESAHNLIYTQESIQELSDRYRGKSMYICGHGAQKLRESDIIISDQIKVYPTMCNAAHLCAEATEMFRNEDFVSSIYHKPNYYKSPHVTVPKHKV